MFRSSSEQESEVEGTLGALLGDSTSTAPTISARHDRMRLSSSSMRQQSLRSSLVYEAPPMEYESTQELREESVRTSSSSTPFSHKQKGNSSHLIIHFNTLLSNNFFINFMMQCGGGT